jgi:hypothetical protein
VAVGQASADFTFTVQPNALGDYLRKWIGRRKFCGSDYPARERPGLRIGQATFDGFDDGFRLASTAGGPMIYESEKVCVFY